MSINDHEDFGADEHGSFRIAGSTRLTVDRANSTILVERCVGKGVFGSLLIDVWLTADDENVRASAQLWLNESDTCPNYDRKGYNLLSPLAIEPNTSRDGIKMTARNNAENQPRDFVAVVFNLSRDLTPDWPRALPTPRSDRG